MGPTTLTCSLACALAAAAPGQQRVDFLRSGASTFVAARAAATAGDARRAAMLYASLAAADPGDRLAARRAVGQAILAGDMPLAVRLAQRQPKAELAVDARLLLIGDALRKGRIDQEVGAEFPQQLDFMAPFVGAWTLAERRRLPEALKLLDGVQASSPLSQFVPEHKALILLAAGRGAEAEPLFTRALAAARGRANRLRIAFATGLVAQGNREGGLALLAGRDVTLRGAATHLATERRPRLPIATAAEGLSELVVALAVGLDEGDSGTLPLGLAQVARHADPRNEQAALLAGLLLDRSGRGDDGIAVFRTLPDKSPFLTEARDAETRILLRASRPQEALARAKAFVADDRAGAADWLRLGDVLEAMKKYDEAAVAYGGAAAAVQAGGPGPELWSIHLLRGAALEQGGKWPQAESALELAYKLAPDNPAVLNYLGYARLERGEQLDEAEALIAEASRRAPDDASITDSLGWAQYKRGKVADAILTLQRAAAADPAQSEIHEHLGDALYAAGRKYEARFAWQAALVTAEDDVRQRVQNKIGAGLSAATAAP
ncbi:tetratricopeptide (TPR) repeat protein [Sphingomonas kaistensis]|uniref:Tetratricopeptide (TPR) repeat protein n=1 Tax=Sphingomonas kaistensis TaxID=298708 RepID=A0A7X5Y883_9SPHN|nr:tetratricopeptide (TPR) repeat protein [Sphingomonas kaistensis]